MSGKTIAVVKSLVEKHGTHDQKSHGRRGGKKTLPREMERGNLPGEPVEYVEETEKKPLDLVDSIMRLETGEMGQDEVVELFQHLVDTGDINQLQGAYGRMAKRLIDAGLVKRR